MRAPINVAPYYDDFDSSKQYTQLLAVPGRVAQAREITQIQSTMKDIVKSLGDSILKDGNVIEGCQVIIGTDGSGKPQVTVTSGRVYLHGMVLPVNESKVSIQGTGTELIGVKLNETIITESEDRTLRDPAQGYDNYNKPGCHRVKSEVIVVVNDTEASTLTTLIDGAIAVEQYAPNYDTLTQTLARRTYDESGSYLVNGLNVRAETDKSDESRFNVVVEAGKAYVLGYELKIPSARRVSVPRSTTVRSVTNRLTYENGVSKYQLESAPYVESITEVQGIVRVEEAVTRGSVDSDRLIHPEVAVVDSVVQGNTTYVRNTDYVLVHSSGSLYTIRWLAGGNAPVAGSSYVVTYQYYTIFNEGRDYELLHDQITDSHKISWLQSGLSPLDGTSFTVKYNMYLAREDVVYMDQFGNIEVIVGYPAPYGFTSAPEVPVNTLALARLTNPPAGRPEGTENTRIIVENVGLTRFTMSDIQKILNRINTISHDQAVLSLNDEAKEFSTANSKKGIFTDPLLDISKIDMYYNLSNGEALNKALPIYDANIDVDDNICFLPVDSSVYDASYVNELTYNVDNETRTFNSTVQRLPDSRTATLSKTGESVVLSQMNATKSFMINPYQQFPQSPEITITPAVDVWIEDNIITVPVSRTSSEVVSTSTRHTSSKVVKSGRFNEYSTQSETSRDTQIGTRVETISSSESIVSEQAITYIRQRTISIRGSHFPPDLDNIRGYFDNVQVPLVNCSINGTEPNTVRSNSSGELSCEFLIPNGVLTGIREVRLESSEPLDEGYYESGAFALYQASGTRRNIQRTVETLTTILLQRVTTVHTTQIVDPVGQTFVLDSMTMVRSVDLYFRNKPSSGDFAAPVTCEIRGVSNGTINSTVYGHKTLSSNEIKVSEDSSVATRFTFDDPVLLEANTECAFVIKSTSSKYTVWVAELGGVDVQSSKLVTTNPYLIGVMLSSSNNSSWTSHQTMDVKFRLIADTYSQMSEAYFSNITDSDTFSRVMLATDSLIPNGTSVRWMYTVDDGQSYTDISPYEMTLLNTVKSNIGLKAVLSRDSNNDRLSPVIALDAVSAVLSHYDNPGHYITRNLTGFDPFININVVLDTYTPAGTSISVYVMTEDGGTLQEVPLESNGAINYNGWRESSYKATVGEATQCRLFIKMESESEAITPAFRRVRVIMS